MTDAERRFVEYVVQMMTAISARVTTFSGPKDPSS